jgi:protein-tyrosine phosphatase
LILVVCTANICRSPIAAALLAQHLSNSVVPGEQFAVSSGGFLARVDITDPFAVSVMSTRGLDISTHSSTQMNESLLRRADLVITMTASHVQQAVDMEPRAWPRVFTLTDLAARMASVGPRRSAETLTSYVARLHAGRSAAALMAAGTAGDIADPYGGPLSAFERTAVQLDQYAGQVASSIVGRASAMAAHDSYQGDVKPRRGLFRRSS